MKRAIAIASCVLLVFAFAGCGGDDDDDDGGAETVDISGEDFEDMTGESAVEVDAIDNQFKQRYIEVSAGTTVTFKNDGRNDHNVIAANEGAFETIDAADFTPGDEAEITFDDPGDYPYYCSLHGTATRGMTGGIRVVE